jgi:hypothetical protein
MVHSRKLIAEFLGVFLIGVAAGAVLISSRSDAQLIAAMGHWNDPDTLEARISAKYANEYHLSPEEIEKIKPLTKELAQDLYKVRHQFGVDILNTLNRDHAAISAQLTPEHRNAFEAKTADWTGKLSAALLGDQNSPNPSLK